MIWIIYDSFFGNTKKVANTISESLMRESTDLDVSCHHVEEVDWQSIKEGDTLVIGSPTRAFGPTKAIKAFLQSVLTSKGKGVKIALFDTRMDVHEVGNGLLTFFRKKTGQCYRYNGQDG